MRHVPVMLAEVVDALNLSPGKNVIDCTLGDAGHAEKILAATAPNGKLLGIDADPESLLRAKHYLYQFGGRAIFVRDNFAELSQIVRENNFGPAHGIVMDLGWSSPQFAERGRGFSFERDEPLDMRYGVFGGEANETAADLLRDLTKAELARVFREFGEEKLAEEIAEAIVGARRDGPVERTGQLAELILQVYRRKIKTKKETPWVGGLHPATKVFQALRIAVNQELDALAKALPQAVRALAPGGRLAVIAFHSLEDRIVKHFLKSQQEKSLRLVAKKPLLPGHEEISANPRAASAKLRVAEKL